MTRTTFLRIDVPVTSNPVSYDVDYDTGTDSGDITTTVPVVLVPVGGELNELTITNTDTIAHVVRIYDEDATGMYEWIVHLLQPNQVLSYAFPPDGPGWTFPPVPVTAIRNVMVSITAPTNGQVLQYDDGVWVNEDLPSTDPVTVEFADLIGNVQPLGTIFYVTDGCAMGPDAVFETTGNGTGVQAVFNGNDWKVVGTNITVSN